MSTIYLAVTPHGCEICHMGVKGMRWGIRRYQKKDGTLTKAGLRKKAKIDEKYRKKLEKYGFRSDNADNGPAMVTYRPPVTYHQPTNKNSQSNNHVDSRKRKEDIIRSGSYKDLLDNVDLFSNSDLEKTITRFQLIDQVKGRVPDNNPKREKADKIIKALRTVSIMSDYASKIHGSVTRMQTNQTELQNAKNRGQIEINRDARDAKRFKQQYERNKYNLENQKKVDALRNERSAVDNYYNKMDKEQNSVLKAYKRITDYRTITPEERKRYFQDDGDVGYIPGSNLYSMQKGNNYNNNNYYKKNNKR